MLRKPSVQHSVTVQIRESFVSHYVTGMVDFIHDNLQLEKVAEVSGQER
jgi:hypothetical protein